MVYNETALDASTNGWLIFKNLNITSDGLLAGFFLLLIFLIILISGKEKFDTIVTMLVASFITSVVGLIFWTLEAIPTEILMLPILMLIVSIIAFVIGN
jgi:hypothetical protein